MREDVADVDLAAIEMDGSYQPVVIARDIEHGEAVHQVSGRKSAAKLRKVLKIGSAHDLKPTVQRRAAIGMLLPKQPQRLPRDNVHCATISQNEILVKL